MEFVHDRLERTAERFGPKPAVICEDRQISYAQLVDGVHLLSGLFVGLGIKPGDRVVVGLGDKPQFVACVYALLVCRAIVVPLPEGVAASTIDQTIKDCSASLLVTSTRDLVHHPRIGEPMTYRFCLLDRVAGNDVLFGGGNGSPRPRNKNDVSYLPIGRGQPSDAAMLLHTSGTTGTRKPVVLTHANLIQATKNINEYTGIEPGTREYVTVPLTHSFGFARVRCIFDVGGTLVVGRGFMNPASFVKSVSESSCNAFSAVPSGVALFEGRMESAVREVASSITFIELGSAPMSVRRKQWLAELFPNARIVMHYGLTEASRSTFLDFRRDAGKLSTVGRPSPHVEVRIDTAAGNATGDGSGEILIRGSHVARGYWERPYATSSTFRDDGWFRSGDFGSIDGDGYITLLGRKDDLINMGGTKIAPLEVENAIREVYSDLDMCVLGVPDPSGIMGELPALCYVPQNGEQVTLSHLHDRMASTLDRFKMPRLLYRVAEIPRTENGKVRRDALRERLAQENTFRKNSPVPHRS